MKPKKIIGKHIKKRVNNIELQVVGDSDHSEGDRKEANFPRNEDLESRPSEASLIKKKVLDSPSYKK